MTSTRSIPWPELAAPVIRIAGHFPLPHSEAELGRTSRDYRGPTMALHLHEYEARWKIRGRTIELRPGDITLTPAGTSNWYTLDRPGRHLCIHFEGLKPQGLTAGLPLWVRPGPAGLAAAERMQAIISLHHQGQLGRASARFARAAAGTSLQALLLWLRWLASRPRSGTAALPPVAEAAVDALRRALDQGYREKWPMARCARTARLSANYLARMFRRKYGITIRAYLFQRRMDYARHLLLTTEDSVKQIAFESGLGPPHYFTRRFRAATGQPPGSYRTGLR